MQGELQVTFVRGEPHHRVVLASFTRLRPALLDSYWASSAARNSASPASSESSFRQAKPALIVTWREAFPGARTALRATSARISSAIVWATESSILNSRQAISLPP